MDWRTMQSVITVLVVSVCIQGAYALGVFKTQVLDIDYPNPWFFSALLSSIIFGVYKLTTKEPEKKAKRIVHRTGQRGHIYYEMLEVAPEVGGLRFYNTVGLSKSPEEEKQRFINWYKYFPNKRYIKNGPRFWLSDEVSGAATERFKTFGGIEMAERATLRIPLHFFKASILNIWKEEQAFIHLPMRRHTLYVFWKAQYVHLLLAPDGTVYIMQSMSIEIDRDLKSELLHEQLPSRLKLPPGWRVHSMILPQDVTIRTSETGMATLIRDHLKNSYQLDAERVLAPFLVKELEEVMGKTTYTSKPAEVRTAKTESTTEKPEVASTTTNASAS